MYLTVAVTFLFRHMATPLPDAKYPDIIAITFDETNNKLTAVYNDHSIYVWDVFDIRRVSMRIIWKVARMISGVSRVKMVITFIRSFLKDRHSSKCYWIPSSALFVKRLLENDSNVWFQNVENRSFFLVFYFSFWKVYWQRNLMKVYNKCWKNLYHVKMYYIIAT